MILFIIFIFVYFKKYDYRCGGRWPDLGDIYIRHSGREV